MTRDRIKYLIEQFTRKFSAIPEDRWTTGEVQNKKGKRCVFGHCLSADLRWTRQSGALDELFTEFRFEAAAVNDRPSSLFPELTPRARVLAALAYMGMMMTPAPAPQAPAVKRVVVCTTRTYRARHRDRDL